jgi:hypothetical protein
MLKGFGAITSCCGFGENNMLSKPRDRGEITLAEAPKRWNSLDVNVPIVISMLSF